MFDIKKELSKLPDKPGVYLMRDKDDEIIYVGKAISLKKRVRQYFDNQPKQPKVRAMVDKVASFEYIIVDNEVEALVLESNFIKNNRPRYNILLRDDKQYPYIKITKESFPRVLKVRSIGKDGAKYFGPFPNVFAVNDIINLFHELFKIRSCNLNFDKGQFLKRPCLNAFIGRCNAPCVHNITPEEYNKDIMEVEEFLKGKHKKLTDQLVEKMKEASKNLNFELAAKLRDNITSIDVIMEKQKVSNTDSADLDLIAIARDEGIVCVQVFFMRNGKIIDREHFFIDDDYEETENDILESFIKQFYFDMTFIPRLVLTDTEPTGRELLETMLSEKSGRKMAIKTPQRGEKVDLMEMVRNNAKEMLDKYISRNYKRERNIKIALRDLEELIGISPIERIECYDISNTSGIQSVGSMIVFENGEKNQKEYRKFKIKTVEGSDDYASHREVLTRRLNRGISELQKGNMDSGFGKLPSLILMDGGKGQVNIAKEVLQELDLDIPVMGLVKDDNHNTRGLIYENIEYPMKVTSPIYRLTYKIQEEAHRFAINYHRKLREDAMRASELDRIKGVGKVRRNALLSHFKDINKIKKSTIEELMEAPKMDIKTATSIYEYFHTKGEEKE